jgi:hypothetical protein
MRGLGIVWGRGDMFNANIKTETLKLSRREALSIVTYYHLGHRESKENPLPQSVYSGPSSRLTKRDQSNIFRKGIYIDQNDRVTRITPRKFANIINKQFLEGTLGHALNQKSQLGVLCGFTHTADVALAYSIPDFMIHPLPPEIGIELSQSLLYTEVAT